MAELKEFVLNDEIIERIRETRIIPVNFYNKKGQVIIPQKTGASAVEIKKLFNFARSGLYYRDGQQLFTPSEVPVEAPAGFSTTKLISLEKTQILANSIKAFISHILAHRVESDDIYRLKEIVSDYFYWFEGQKDVLKGLININEICPLMESDYSIQLAVKRAVIVMSLKSRIILRKTARNRQEGEQSAIELMMAAILSNIGLEKFNHKKDERVKGDDIVYLRQYPLITYLHVARLQTIPDRVKTLLLVQKFGSRMNPNNNAPDRKWLADRLRHLGEKYVAAGKKNIALDMLKRSKVLQSNEDFSEDASLLSIAAEMASLTTRTPWRPAMYPEEAVQKILNESMFSYRPSIVQEFLDYVAISLSRNIKFLVKNKVVVVQAADGQGRYHYEVGLIITEGMYQARPEIMRLGRIEMKIKKTEKQKLIPFFLPNTMEPDPRFIIYDLNQDRTRKIAYAPDYEMNGELIEIAHTLLEASPSHARKRLTEIPALI